MPLRTEEARSPVVGRKRHGLLVRQHSVGLAKHLGVERKRQISALGKRLAKLQKEVSSGACASRWSVLTYQAGARQKLGRVALQL